MSLGPNIKTTVKKKEEKQKELIIMTYNVSYGLCEEEDRKENSFIKRFIQCINESNADFIFLQESHEAYEYFTRRHCKETYPYQYYHHREDGWIASGIACLSKHKFGTKIIKPGVDGSYFPGMIVSYDGIDFVNCHLRPPLKMGNGSLFSLDHLNVYFYEAPEIHKKEVEYLLKNTSSSNIIVLGDFNESEFSWMKDKGFKDGLNLSKDITTWYWPIGLGLNIWGSYDHIYYSSNFECIECLVDTNYKNLSDHLPVTCKIKY